MGRGKEQGFRIDPVRSSRLRTGHPVLSTLFALIFAAALYGCVWFLGFSEYGFAWSGNAASIVNEQPDMVVTSYPRVEITLDEVALLLDLNETASLNAHFKKLVSEDIKFGDLKVKWRSENPSVASVDSLGNIKAFQPGSARIFVTIANSDIDSNTAHCLVTVRKWRDSNSDDKSRRRR